MDENTTEIVDTNTEELSEEQQMEALVIDTTSSRTQNSNCPIKWNLKVNMIL